MSKNKYLSELLELANRYPSPHNGQPIKLRKLDNNNFDIIFDKQRGLKATDISFIFSYVSVGVFIEHLSLCSKALGHKFSYLLDLPKESDLHGDGSVKVATCTFAWSNLPTDPDLKRILQERQTSRKKYYQEVDDQTTDTLLKCAERHNMKLGKLDKPQANQAIWLNQRAVFDDMFDEPVREELNHWLRYTLYEKETKKDGLAYDCMELNGRVMKMIINHPGILRAPVLSWLIKHYYLRTMVDKSNVFYVLAPFATENDAYRVGELIMQLWTIISREGYYLHPFGTIMSNNLAHQDFVKLAHITDETRQHSYVVFIFRAGKSQKPNPSLRIPVNEHLLVGEV